MAITAGILTAIVLSILWWWMVARGMKHDEMWGLLGIYGGPLPLAFGFYVFLFIHWLYDAV